MEIHKHIFNYRVEEMVFTVKVFIHQYSKDFYREFRIFFKGEDVTNFVKNAMEYTYLELSQKVDLEVKEFEGSY